MNNGTIPSISPVAALRGGETLAPEKSINYTAGVVLDTGEFSLTADYFRISVSDRIGITSNFTLLEPEIEGLLAEGIEAARDLRRFRFFTNAFSTTSQGVDLVSTFTPLALRGNTTISAVFNYTDTEVTDNRKGLLNDRRLTEFAYALPRTRWNIGLTQQVGRVSVLGRVNYFGGWYDFDSGFAQSYLPSDGIDQGFFDGRPIIDVEASIALGGGASLAIGAQNAFNSYPGDVRRREVQRVHAVGLQRRLLLRAGRLRVGQLTALLNCPLVRITDSASRTASSRRGVSAGGTTTRASTTAGAAEHAAGRSFWLVFPCQAACNGTERAHGSGLPADGYNRLTLGHVSRWNHCRSGNSADRQGGSR